MKIELVARRRNWDVFYTIVKIMVGIVNVFDTVYNVMMRNVNVLMLESMGRNMYVMVGNVIFYTVDVMNVNILVKSMSRNMDIMLISNVNMFDINVVRYWNRFDSFDIDNMIVIRVIVIVISVQQVIGEYVVNIVLIE
uniref:Uncharacterized protein n=1 Tax=Cacopsylla melanoneura TaxID=428564 RepID=A0A8D9FEU8_9HEMI